MEYILHGVNYQTLIMMLSDAPRLVRRKRDAGQSAEAEAKDIIGFFQSKLR